MDENRLTYPWLDVKRLGLTNDNLVDWRTTESWESDPLVKEALIPDPPTDSHHHNESWMETLQFRGFRITPGIQA